MNLSNTLIAIPSYQRVGRVRTHKTISTELLRNNQVHLVVDSSEYKDYCKAYKDVGGLMVTATRVKGIARTRQWILTTLARKYNVRYVIMLDDDMWFFKRPNMQQPKLVKCSADLPILWMSKMLNRDYAHVGISARQGNNHVDQPFVKSTRSMNVYGYDTNVLNNERIKFGRVPVMEDFDLTLQLLRLGYPNAVAYKYAWNQADQSNAQGGCSGYRTHELQKSAAHRLAELHPDYVRVVRKKSKWPGMEDRYDVRIQWRKAIKDAEEAK